MDEERSRPTVLALVNDLIFASKIRGAGAAAGVTVRTESSAERVLEACRTVTPGLIVVDLETRSADVPELIERLGNGERTRSVPVVAFASHVNRDAIEAARAAGADRVLARSAFVRELPRLLSRAGAAAGPEHEVGGGEGGAASRGDGGD